MKILSAEQIRAWDASTIQHEPISSLALMERAAGCCADWILQSAFRQHHFQVFCGPGNNGGDGLVIARLLHAAGCHTEIWLTETSKRSPDCQSSLEKAVQAGVPIHFLRNNYPPLPDQRTVIVDALLGTGLRAAPSGEMADLIRYINQTGLPVISIDLPSGMLADHNSTGNTIIKARHTLSLGCYKPAFMWNDHQEYTGKIHLLDIGLDPAFLNRTTTHYYTVELADARQLYRPRPGNFHKYQFGHALLLAGSDRMMGAAILAARACLRSGAGLATVHCPLHRMPLLQAAVPEAIATDEEDTGTLFHKKAAIGAGPGWEISPVNSRLLEQALTRFAGPLILDASALTILQPLLPLLKERTAGTTLLTPHAGEFDRLFGRSRNDEERMQLARQMAMHFNCCILLKGKYSMTALPDGQLYFNTSGNSGMATAGSGDVLTGLITGLCAQGYPLADASRLGAFLHGLAGDAAAAAGSEESMIAGDIIHCLGTAFRQLSVGVD